MQARNHHIRLTHERHPGRGQVLALLSPGLLPASAAWRSGALRAWIIPVTAPASTVPALSARQVQSVRREAR